MLVGMQFEAHFIPEQAEFVEKIVEATRMAWNAALDETPAGETHGWPCLTFRSPVPQ